MFSGIIEARAQVLKARQNDSSVQIEVARPKEFDDIGLGDSIATSGVCLTIEKFTPDVMFFTLGPETLRVTQWSADFLQNKIVNLERSLRLGDRIHGHLVSGHVDTIGEIVSAKMLGQDANQSLEFTGKVDRSFYKYFPVKGSWTVNGVSLTINDVVLKGNFVEVTSCLIPETLKRTNLNELKVGNSVNIEIDFMLRALMHSFNERQL